MQPRKSYSLLLLLVVSLWFTTQPSPFKAVAIPAAGTAVAEPGVPAKATHAATAAAPVSAPAPDAFYAARRSHLYNLTAANPQAAYEDIAGNRANLPLTAANDEQPLVARESLAVNIARGEGKSWTTRVFTDARSGKSYETYTWGTR